MSVVARGDCAIRRSSSAPYCARITPSSARSRSAACSCCSESCCPSKAMVRCCWRWSCGARTSVHSQLKARPTSGIDAIAFVMRSAERSRVTSAICAPRPSFSLADCNDSSSWSLLIDPSRSFATCAVSPAVSASRPSSMRYARCANSTSSYSSRSSIASRPKRRSCMNDLAAALARLGVRAPLVCEAKRRAGLRMHPDRLRRSLFAAHHDVVTHFFELGD